MVSTALRTLDIASAIDTAVPEEDLLTTRMLAAIISMWKAAKEKDDVDVLQDEVQCAMVVAANVNGRRRTPSERWRWRRNRHTGLFSSMMAERNIVLTEREGETKAVSY